MNESVLITGSSRGIGKNLAMVFAMNNWDVILHGRNEEELETAYREVSRFPIQVDIVRGDLKKNKTLDRLCRIAQARDISVLINNAAVTCPGLPLTALSDRNIDEMIETNLSAPIKLSRRVYPILAGKKGFIININSLAGVESKKFRSIYSASKWGLRGFSGSLRLESEKDNISIVDVYLSKVKTKESDSYGMDVLEVAEKIFNGYTSSAEIVIDGRPTEFKVKANEHSKSG